MNGDTKYNPRYLNTFLNQLTEFLEKLEKSFPDENDITLLHLVIIGARKANPELILDQWDKHILVYDEQIKKKDFSHFMTMKYDDHLNELENKDEINMKIDYFKKILESKDTDNETRESIWRYLKLLNGLCRLAKENGSP